MTKRYNVVSWDRWEDAAPHISQLPADLHETEAPCYRCRFYDADRIACRLEDVEMWRDKIPADCPAKCKGEKNAR